MKTGLETLNTVNSEHMIKKQEIACPSLKHKVKYGFYCSTKRLIDIIGGLVGCLILIPLTIIIAIANFITGDRGPIFFVNERIGRNGKTFKMYKFRSMVENADEKLYKYLEENEEARIEYQKYKKLKYDPRITKIGQFIRKTSLDEWPQFINVLKGDMTLVGPRPYLEREKQDMNDTYSHIISVKPGVTGLWQIKGRSDLTFEERLLLDKIYLKNRSLTNDIGILFQTAKKLITKEGAI